MIDVEIKGPLSKKDYERVKKLLATAGDGSRCAHRVTVSYRDRGFNDRGVRIEERNGTPRIVIETGRVGERKELQVALAPGGFSDGIALLAELGYKKGTVRAEEVCIAWYGGAFFSLIDPKEDIFYYEASITTQDPTEAKEAKQKLEKIAKNLKLPIWTPLDMLAFLRKLHETTQTMYDYDTDGATYFRDKFGV
jgi:adenylate cyclase class IV